MASLLSRLNVRKPDIHGVGNTAGVDSWAQYIRDLYDRLEAAVGLSDKTQHWTAKQTMDSALVSSLSIGSFTYAGNTITEIAFFSVINLAGGTYGAGSATDIIFPSSTIGFTPFWASVMPGAYPGATDGLIWNTFIDAGDVTCRVRNPTGGAITKVQTSWNMLAIKQ